ncbi:MAG: glycerophosphodiester phosphodiesterase [Vicinamibacterales bacterium]
MRHPFFLSPRPLLFAHRGGSGIAPENTLAAFDRAVRLGVDGLELDVRFSRDRLVVVHHDASLARTTDRTVPVATLSADELARVDAGWHFQPSGPDAPAPFRGQGCGVPTFKEVLRRYRDARIIVELKLNEPALARGVLADVRDAAAEDRVCLASFGCRVLREARRLAPHVATSAAREEVRWALYRSWLRWPVSRVAYSGYQVPETSGVSRIVSPRFVRHAHDAGLGVQVWTVDDPETARRLLAWGVDALISDRPDRLQTIVAGHHRKPSAAE